MWVNVGKESENSRYEGESLSLQVAGTIRITPDEIVNSPPVLRWVRTQSDKQAGSSILDVLRPFRRI